MEYLIRWLSKLMTRTLFGQFLSAISLSFFDVTRIHFACVFFPRNLGILSISSDTSWYFLTNHITLQNKKLKISFRTKKNRLSWKYSAFKTYQDLYLSFRTLTHFRPMFHLRTNLVVGSYLWRSDILIKDAGDPLASLLKMSLFHRCFSNIFSSKNQLPGL